MNEHEDYQCTFCKSRWIRWEHIDKKDCDQICDDPCLLRCCNEEDCTAGDVWINPISKST